MVRSSPPPKWMATPTVGVCCRGGIYVVRTAVIPPRPVWGAQDADSLAQGDRGGDRGGPLVVGHRQRSDAAVFGDDQVGAQDHRDPDRLPDPAVSGRSGRALR